MPLTPNRRDIDRVAAEREVPEGFSLAAIRARNGVTATPPVRLIAPKRAFRRPSKPRRPSRPQPPRVVDPAREARSTDRYRELRVIFSPEQATALVLAGYAMRPGRFQTRGSSVAPACMPAKAAHDGYPRGLGRPALLPRLDAEVTGDA